MAVAAEAVAGATLPFCAVPAVTLVYVAPAPDIEERSALGVYDDDDDDIGARLVGCATCARACVDQLAPEFAGEDEDDGAGQVVVPFEYG
jgi:hypothetical protein